MLQTGGVLSDGIGQVLEGQQFHFEAVGNKLGIDNAVDVRGLLELDGGGLQLGPGVPVLLGRYDLVLGEHDQVLLDNFCLGDNQVYAVSEFLAVLRTQSSYGQDGLVLEVDGVNFLVFLVLVDQAIDRGPVIRDLSLILRLQVL